MDLDYLITAFAGIAIWAAAGLGVRRWLTSARRRRD